MIRAQGELKLIGGAASIGDRTASYCPQKPFFFAGTVKQNIIAGRSFDADRYASVVIGVCMGEDIKAWPEGDSKEVDVSGAGLSGGQRVRLNLARALYAQNPTLVLDDPFSSLDKTTKRKIINFILHLATAEKRTVIVATHSIDLLQKCQSVLVLEQGRVVTQGSFAFLMHQNHPIFTKLLSSQRIVKSENTEVNEMRDVGGTRSESKVPREFTSQGVISMDVICLYLRRIGTCMAVTTLISLASMQLAMTSVDVWIEYWSGHSTMSPQTFIVISAVLCSILTVTVILRAFSFAMSCLRAAAAIFQSLLSLILSFEIEFFQEYSFGTILNLLGRDTYAIDDELPFSLNILLAQTFTLLGGAIIVISSFWVMVIPLVLIAVVFYKLQLFYRMSSREVRRFLTANRSGVYLTLVELLHHGPLVRAESLKEFLIEKFVSALNKDLSYGMTSAMISYWLIIRMKLLGASRMYSILFQIKGMCRDRLHFITLLSNGSE